jgi:hypothetical protein
MMSKLVVATFFLSAAAAVAPRAGAAPTIAVRCGANEDRVWVYESLVDFNVETKLKCGDQVEILDRVKGYVKIRTASGDEGFVVATSFPKSAIPPEPEDHSHDLQAVSQQMLANQRAHAAPSASASAVSVESAPVAAPSPQPAPVAVATKSSSAPTPAAKPVVVAASTPVVQPAAQPALQPVAARPAPPTIAPSPKPVVVAATPKPTVVAASTPAPAAIAHETEITLTTASTAPAVQPSVAVSSTTTPTAAPPAAVAAPQPQPAVAYVAPAPTPAAKPVAEPVVAKAPVDPDADEVSTVPVESTANCTSFFAAYGLSPNQFKWIEQNRKKAFPTVCPAPTPAMVDYIVIFTHDVDFYSVTLPTPVHRELNGFSDWAPLSTVDTALMSPSDANKSHHEYVWVFHARRGTYDPAAFSAHRKPLFSKDESNMLGSHGGFKTVMDALTWIETTGAARETAQK